MTEPKQYPETNKVNELLMLGEKMLSDSGVIEPSSDARHLLCHVMKWKLPKLFINHKARIKEKEKKLYYDLLQKRSNRIPLNYITQKKEFMGMEFKIIPGIFIPRPETELLVEESAKLVSKNTDSGGDKVYPVTIDIGTGSGNVAVSLKKLLDNADMNSIVYATDIDPLCLEVARTNAEANDVKVDFYHGDLFSPFKYNSFKNKIDLIVSNPPYISAKDLKRLQKEITFEPRRALDGGKDGLDFYRLLAKDAKSYITHKGFIVMEIGYNQKKPVIKIFEDAGYNIRDSKKDFSNIDRVVIVQWMK